MAAPFFGEGGASHDSPRLLVHGQCFVVFLFPLFLDLSTSTETLLCTSPDHLSLASQTLQTNISKLYATENMFSTLPSYVPRRRMFGTFPGLFPPQGPHSLQHFKVNKKKKRKGQYLGGPSWPVSWWRALPPGFAFHRHSRTPCCSPSGSILHLNLD